tara:strand:+ start:2015 stop:2485 length:471 start_codon:yes stop_codon:yes gene_type:complete
MAFKMKGWSGYQKSPLKTDETLVQGARDAVEDKTSGQLAKSKALSDGISGATDVAKTALTKRTDPPKKKYPKNYTKEDIKFLKDQNEDVVRDDDKVEMTKKEQRKHRRDVLRYNKNVAKPLTDAQKNKIREQLSKMDPKDPEAKLLRKMLNLKKNR